jgi:hypothetical protein
MPNITTNELGQTVVTLSQEEWENYGVQAGYTATTVKEASNNNSGLKKIAEIHNDIKFHQKEILNKIAQIDALLEGEEVEEIVEASEEAKSDEFTADNYPNLVAQQEQEEGLIGAFAPRL